MLRTLKSTLEQLHASLRGKRDEITFILGYLDYLGNLDESELKSDDVLEELNDLEERLWELVETTKRPEVIRAYVGVKLMIEKISPSEDSIKTILKNVTEELENYYFSKSL
ncbi:protein of unknown function (plasmid) [Thermococcus nautili]|nr:protein of unknown function [Thermococcus nautili]